MAVTATEAELGALHSQIAKVMRRVLSNYEKAQAAWELLMDAAHDPNLAAQALTELPDISPAMLGAITKFLADNKITAAPEDSAETSALAQALAAKADRREQRKRNRVDNIVPFAQAE